MPFGISVVICCYNSATRLPSTLQHLCKQKGISKSSWEVILINNCSTDNTVETANQLWNSLTSKKPDFKIINESTPGLSAARQKGIDESRFDYVLFCDDDNWLDENYLSNALDIIKQNPRIGALGGTGSPVFEKEEPPYFRINQYHTLATGEQSEIDGDITDERGVLYGAGMVLNKIAYKQLQETYQFQFLLSDRKSNNLLSSGDHELCLALRKIGFKIYFSKKLFFKHYIPGYRTTIKYYKKLFLGFGKSYAMLQVYRVNRDDLNSIKNDYRYIMVRCMKNILFLYLRLLASGYYFTNNKYRYVDQLHRLYGNIGQLTTMLEVKNIYKTQFSNLSLFNKNI
jgi:glycosyltransferase involved in cell wall biosynthesis